MKKAYKRMMKFIGKKEYEIRLEWINKRTYGDIDFSTKIIRINLPLFVSEVYIHEYLHYRGINSEKTTEMGTEYFLKRMLVKQIKKLAKKVMEKGGEDDKDNYM